MKRKLIVFVLLFSLTVGSCASAGGLLPSLTDTIGGSELTVPAQAAVTMSRFSGFSLSAQLTSTTGVGFSMVEGEREM